MESDPTKVTIEVLRTELQARYARIKERNKNSKEKDKHALEAVMQYDDAALGAFFAEQLKGSCNKCDNYGHKSVDSRERQSQRH